MCTSPCIAGRCAGVTWNAGPLPGGSGVVVTVTVGSRTEYHICCDLTLTGSGIRRRPIRPIPGKGVALYEYPSLTYLVDNSGARARA
jgi:hypothetical protein